jgi:hypothetical protein
MSKYTSYINNININNIRNQINLKNSCNPYIATLQESSGVLTDYDTFPYPRWFKGQYNSSYPIISEREAGWRPLRNNCYRLGNKCNEENIIPYPNHCFEAACSTIYPCYPSSLEKTADKEQLDIILNKSCIVQYR